MMSLQGAKRGGGNSFQFLTIRNGLLPASQARCRNDGPQRLLRLTLSVILAMTIVLAPCQAAVEFDGINDSIDIIDSDSQDLLSNFTISAWAKSTGPTEYSFIFGTADASDLNGYYITIHDVSQKAIVYSCDAVTCSSAAGTTNIKNDSTWHHIVGTFNGTNLDVYVDEIKEGSSASTRTPTNNILTQRIGGSHFGGRNFRGEIDDVRIYNRALSISEIETLYNSRSKRPSGSLANGLIAHYEMDDDQISAVTAQAKDDSGNNNHGQFIGFNNLTTALRNDIPVQIGTGHSLEFDGTNDKITASNSPSLNNWNEQTITAWIKTDSTALGADLRIIEKGANNEWTLTTNRNGFIGQVGLQVGSTVYRGVNTTILSSDNQWHFVAGRISSTYFTELFVDNERGSIATTGSGSPKTGNISIGEFGGAPSNRFTGLIDDVRIYNKSLTNGEISFLYNGSGLDPGTSNLQALWNFDEDSALKDSSGNNNHGLGVGGDSLKYTEGVLRR